MEFHTNIPADVLERLRESIAAVDVAKRKHLVVPHPETFAPYISFEGYNILLDVVKGVKS